jgi:hypothetical protein
MPLNDEEMEKANQYFELNGVVPDCPYCSMHGWESGELISTTVVDEQGSAQPEALLMAKFTCDNCGHISLFDARRLGLLSG